MTKRYIMPTWEEFSKDRMVLVGYADNPFTVKVGDRPVRKDDYNAIREATAVERITMETWNDFGIELVAAAKDFYDHYGLSDSEVAQRLLIALKPFIASPESERLVGKARGEDGLGWKDAFGPRPGASWADVGGGEEKPVRAAAPAANKPRCDNCRFGHVVKNPINDGVMCQRFPQHRFIDSDDAPVHWCGEWRAK